ncbi:MAG: heme-binding protein [Lachnospiraceae bacterium]|nr:heme-binding protein [Lachnospiraceae bacterium]MDD3794469.1 heme-binding protein [Lachnospiraceae bacterium]
MAFEAENYKIVTEQEEKLQFTSFNSEDAWNLGNIVIKKALEHNDPILCEIWINHYLVFRYGCKGSCEFNSKWVRRKINTVNMMEKSSLQVHLLPFVGGDDIFSELQHFDSSEYANIGGGFPLRIRGTGVAGAIAVSGLPHEKDHQLIVDCMSEFLGLTDIKHVIEG